METWCKAGGIMSILPPKFISQIPASMAHVYDRTIEDVLYALVLKQRKDTLGWDGLTDNERVEFLAGLKGCYNAKDLQRLEDICEWLYSRMVPKPPIVLQPAEYKPWAADKIPDEVQMERIRSNIEILRNTYTMPSQVPQVPLSFSVTNIDINIANNLEIILLWVEYMLERGA